MTEKNTSLTVALAAGGTGGHLFPAKALAEELKRLGHHPIFYTDDRTAQYLASEGKDNVRIIPSGTFSRKGLVKGLWHICKGIYRTMVCFREDKVDVVVGFGGYPSLPVVYNATSSKKKQGKYTTILHEQNAVMGRVNRLFVPKVAAVATAFDKVHGVASGHGRKLAVTGNPVRPDIRALYGHTYTPPEKDGEFHILVIGGSQGAAVFSDVVPEAIKQLPPEMQQRLHITQQCRQEDLDRVKVAYGKIGVQAELAPFFGNMPELYQWAHVVICRSGAGTVSELAVAGVPSVLVPYPYAKDQHQLANAQSLSVKKAAWLMPQNEFTAEALANDLVQFMSHPKELAECAANVKKEAHPDAVEKLARLVVEQAREKRA